MNSVSFEVIVKVDIGLPTMSELNCVTNTIKTFTAGDKIVVSVENHRVYVEHISCPRTVLHILAVLEDYYKIASIQHINGEFKIKLNFN